MFEIFESGLEILENFIFRIFLQYVVKKTKTGYELFGMFLSYVAYSYCFVDEFHEVVMTAEIEIVGFFYFAVNYFSYVEVV